MQEGAAGRTTYMVWRYGCEQFQGFHGRLPYAAGREQRLQRQCDSCCSTLQQRHIRAGKAGCAASGRCSRHRRRELSSWRGTPLARAQWRSLELGRCVCYNCKDNKQDRQVPPHNTATGPGDHTRRTQPDGHAQTQSKQRTTLQTRNPAGQTRSPAGVRQMHMRATTHTGTTLPLHACSVSVHLSTPHRCRPVRQGTCIDLGQDPASQRQGVPSGH